MTLGCNHILLSTFNDRCSIIIRFLYHEFDTYHQLLHHPTTNFLLTLTFESSFAFFNFLPTFNHLLHPTLTTIFLSMLSLHGLQPPSVLYFHLLSPNHLFYLFYLSSLTLYHSIFSCSLLSLITVQLSYKTSTGFRSSLSLTRPQPLPSTDSRSTPEDYFRSTNLPINIYRVTHRHYSGVGGVGGPEVLGGTLDATNDGLSSYGQLYCGFVGLPGAAGIGLSGLPGNFCCSLLGVRRFRISLSFYSCWFSLRWFISADIV